MPASDDVEAAVDRLVRRLRGFSPRSWSVGGRRAAAHQLAATLVSLDPAAAGHDLPDVPDHAWGDAIAVLAADALAAGAPREAVLAAVRLAWEQTR